MRFLLGLFFFSILLTAGSSLKCEFCASTTSNCSGPEVICSKKNSVCMTVITEIITKKKIPASMKRCSSVDDCKHYEGLKGKLISGQPLNITDNLGGLLIGSVIKDVICSEVLSSFASQHSLGFFSAFLGLLLMKLLF
ncbi:phospholipase A2 inhibitor gamma subunit B-like [Pantherophis guttatus]|uniref:Phospholipase A2 inhibitor subunit gamma B-like n=1 Tax=Pantherophis guttatus TaxID=94885 RepID=A0A6P9DRR7_PANGU|nr:phospholipase A2 inhibitor gamma subunit B-like [Pantherophis guttatus]XP_034293826.1 phospholipase A2 inhibitor gamma subunit B-like [Pantherophis guttatus]